MKLLQAIEILTDHLKWRNGDGDVYPEFNVRETNQAITTAIDALRLLDDVRTDSALETEHKTYAVVQMSRIVWNQVEKLT